MVVKNDEEFRTEDPLTNSNPYDPKNEGKNSSDKFLQFMVWTIAVALAIVLIMSLVRVLLPYALLALVVFVVVYAIVRKRDQKKQEQAAREAARKMADEYKKKYGDVTVQDPTVSLAGLASAGNIAANKIVERYHELEELYLDNDLNVNNLRAEYGQKFSSVRDLIDVCADAKKNPDTYEDPEGLLHKTSKAINALMDEMLNKERQVKKSHVVMAEAAMDYLRHGDNDIVTTPDPVESKSAPVATGTNKI